MAVEADFVNLTHPVDALLTISSEHRFRWGEPMAGDSLGPVRDQISECMAEIRSRAERLSPLDIHSRMDAIRRIAAANGLDALEGLMHRSAQLALLPGHCVATRCCIEHLDEALESESPSDRTAILAALAVRLN